VVLKLWSWVQAGLVGVVVSACAAPQYRAEQRATLAAPVQLAEGDTGKPALAEDPDHQKALARRQQSGPPPAGYAPDPPPLTATAHLRLSLHLQRGELRLEKLLPVHYEKPVASERKVGRFAVELWIGHELLERARFDFPLLGAPVEEAPANGDSARPKFDSGADVTRDVQVAFSERATRAVVVDRATGHTWELHWPPVTAKFEAYALSQVEAVADTAP
jgi:hypothetical protein